MGPTGARARRGRDAWRGGLRRGRLAGACAAIAVAAGLIAARGAPATAAAAQSQAAANFAGYVWGGRITSVQGSWRVPRIGAGSPSGYAATWIGAQAPGTPAPLIELGIEEDQPGVRVATRVRRYWAFWADTSENLDPQFLFAVRPGDRIFARIALIHGVWRLRIRDRGRDSSSLSTSDETSASFDQADWLQEHYGGGYPLLSAVTFRRLAVDAARPDPAALSPLTMSLAGGLIVTPGPIAHDSFGVGAG